MTCINRHLLQHLSWRRGAQYSTIQSRVFGCNIAQYGLCSSLVPARSNKVENRKRQLQSRFSSSVSEVEVNKFSELSKSWWDPQLNPLIGMNSIRVDYIINEIRKTSTSTDRKTDIDVPIDVVSNVEGPSQISRQIPLPLSGLKALDVGCGGGLLSESLSRLGADVVAVDPSRTLVEHAKQHADLDPRTRSIDYRGGCTIEQLAQDFPVGSFDIVCILEVLEHAADAESILQAAKSLLKPNTGRLFLSTMNRTVKSHIVAIIGAEYVMGYLPPGTHDWNQFRSPREVEEMMHRAGLEQTNVQGMVITKPPFQGIWVWKLDEMDTDVNWIGTYKVA